MIDYKSVQKGYIELFDGYAERKFDSLSLANPKLIEAMRYSFFAGGKRVRPVLMLATASMLGVSSDRALPFAFALECVHTYSLIHDDLPAMDNDDYRRGRLTNHKVYGEAMAILAGDALLNLAFSVCCEQCVENTDKNTCMAARYLADCAGLHGMISGQVSDILSEQGRVKDAEVLADIEVNKTAKLIMASVVIPAILADANVALIEDFGKKLGVQFQIVDDILDTESNLSVLGKTVGKDEAAGKLTYVTYYGKDAAKKRVTELYSECISLISGLKNNGFITDFCKNLALRIN